jgi:hypothetical protein
MAYDPCCTTVIGGEVFINAEFKGPGTGNQSGGHAQYQALGEVRLQPAAIERTAGAASAGQVWITEASRPIRAVLSFVNRCNPNPMRMFCERCSINITIVEKSRGIEHLLTSCITVGAPEINFATGEISGMEIVCAGTYTVSASDALPYTWCQASYAAEPGTANVVTTGAGGFGAAGVPGTGAAAAGGGVPGLG